MRGIGFIIFSLVVKYPTVARRVKLTKRKRKMNRLLSFLPDNPAENLINISQAKTRKGRPSRIEISVNFDI
jgi:hypothetical protein